MLKIDKHIISQLSRKASQYLGPMALMLGLMLGNVLDAKGEMMGTNVNIDNLYIESQEDSEAILSNCEALNTDTMSIEFINIKPFGCGIAINGAATVAVTGGVAPYTYEWSTSPKQLGPRAIRLSPGTYSITVEDNTGNQVVDSIEIIASPMPIELECPGFGILESCQTQDEIDSYLENWLVPFRSTEMKYANFTYDIDINGNVSTGIDDLDAVQLDSTIEGYLTIQMIVTCGTSSDSCMSTLFITEPTPLICAVPDDMYTGDCDSLAILFRDWVDQFQFGGGCGASATYQLKRSNGTISNYTSLDSIPAPAICGESLELEIIASDQEEQVNCSAKFVSLAYLPSYNGTGLQGPSQVCPSSDGHIYNWTTEGQVLWSYSGQGAELIDTHPNGIELGFRKNASEGYLTIDNVSEGLQDTLFVEMAPSTYCTVDCPEGLVITPFKLEEGGATVTFQATSNLSIEGATSNTQEITLASGEEIQFGSGFTISQNSILKAMIQECQNGN